ncbi:hypothetical protein TARUN_1727 [Trichoderma arundinaceum]|uniref:Uncharacterized protein n=1 Tax=Trichoderma arundinaceum TaxID=490622 RepID=A0A395NWN0_TRIAR|nr:hypothetical protein TARUN_1727 [Trichoderma arundinaceum]
MAAVEDQAEELPWFLRTSYPVLFPSHEALTKSQADFDEFLLDELRGEYGVLSLESLGDSMEGVALAAEEKESSKKEKKKDDEEFFNRMLTENMDVAYRSTQNSIVDLFYELEEVVSGPRLKELLDAAWAMHPLITLKIIFNARSIHLGKSSKNVFYRAAGWLAQNHPLTLVSNLRWLSRPVIEKKVKKEGENDYDEGFVKVEKREGDENAVDRFDVQYGVSHGYWKDLLNLLVLAMQKKLDVLEDPRDVLNVENVHIKRTAMKRREKKQTNLASQSSSRRRRNAARGRGGAAARVEKKEQKAGDIAHVLEEKTVRIGNPGLAKHVARDERHEANMRMFTTNALYRALHVSVARLFAEQLHSDLTALRGSDPKAKRVISLCAKWAPSHGNFHDRQTCIISSIAEILYPRESLDGVITASASREVYLRHAREQYRKDVSALRKHLEVVERNISANTFEKIKYERVPSIAMQNYTKLFIRKDFDHFHGYISKVAEGKANISGAVLLPSTLVHSVSQLHILSASGLQHLTPEQLVERTVKELEAKVAEGQWKTLVQRIKDSGTLSSCIAVCDVSGSMSSPRFNDGTNPMDSAIGLSLLVAEATEQPFGGKFITFHSTPKMVSVDTNMTFHEKVQFIKRADWGGSTNLVAVFEDLILPMAIKKKVKKKDMVKRVFVFSDMQFDSAEASYGSSGGDAVWSSSFERIKKKFNDRGYELPELVFWNLAGGRAGYDSWASGGDDTAPKPVLAGEAGTALVSGYSQGMLKVFLENGSFEEEEEEEEEQAEVKEEEEKEEKEETKEKATEDADEANEEEVPVQKEPTKKAKTNPLTLVKKAISHKAYDMLEVLD